MSQTTNTGAPETPAVADPAGDGQGREDALTKKLDAMSTQLTDLLEQRKNDARNVGPFARKGESSLTSRGYSYLKLFQQLNPDSRNLDEAKVEMDLSNRLNKKFQDMGYTKDKANSIMAPTSAALLGQVEGFDQDFINEVDGVVKAGVHGYDPGEVASVARRYNKALSWIDESTGSVLIAPPMLGDLIELLRVNEALMMAGARVMAMPPNGRITFPRQTDAATAYWIGESTTITDSTPATGSLELTAKKLGIIIKIPNELFRFASISVEQFVRDDIARVASIAMDKALLDAAGSSVKPKGLINYANITLRVASTTGANGDTLEPEDVLKLVSDVEENNATFRTFIMRPAMYAALANRRADAVSGGDSAGPFVFSLTRGLGDMDQSMDRASLGRLSGYPVVKSTNVAGNRAKGSASNLTYVLGGDFNDFLIAMSGVIEFTLSTQGDTPFQQDQTWVRGINYTDGGPRHEASFAWIDDLILA